MKKIIFLDTETSSVDNPGLIQLSFITVDLESGHRDIYSEYMKTEKKISFEAMAVHHITPRILEEKGIDLDVAEIHEIEDLLRDAWIVAHNAKFDKRVLDLNGITTDPS